MTPYECAKVVIRAAEIKEESFVKGEGELPLHSYKLDECESAKQALEEAKLPVEFARLIGLALNGWWNDTLAWAEELVP